jgi:predicted permease
MASAIVNILIANEYGLDRALVAGAIVWTTVVVVLVGLAAALV